MPGHLRVSLTLTDAERATLRGWANSRTASQAQALRARIVLACESGAGGAAAASSAIADSLGVSRDTVALWRSRFLVHRLAGLADQPRRGRPKAVPETAATEILQTMLGRPPTGTGSWSTRSVATATGLSQTTVSRIWRTWWPGAPAHEVPVGELVGVYFSPVLRALALSAPTAPAGRVPRVGLPTVLAAAEFCRTPALPGREAAPASDGEAVIAARALRSFLALLDRKVAAPRNVQVVVAGGALTDHAVSQGLLGGWRRRQRFHVQYASSRSAWQSYVRNAQGLARVAEEVHRWCGAGGSLISEARDFMWIAPGRDTSGPKRRMKYDSPPGTSTSPPGLPGIGRTDRLADQVVYALKEAMAGGEFAPGDRITEAPLASRLGVSRGPVRDALRMLADEGLLDLLPNRGAVIPTVHVTDVLEAYAARVALGTMLLRRLVTLEPASLVPVNAALDEVSNAVHHGDMRAMVEADTVFQDAFAHAARLPRTASIFRGLNMQLRLFTSILGLDYADASDPILRQNAAILDALRRRSGHEAVRHWRAKVEYMVRYMARQLSEEDFDVQLWQAMTGGPGT